MSGFDVSWLALREPADGLARSAAITDALASWLVHRCGGREARIIDLGCGSGANPRWLAPRLPCAQKWLCVDDDPRLLAALAADPALALSGVRAHDLAAGFDALAGEPRDVVTASALLDLVSAPWLDAVLGFAASAQAAVLFPLNCDGRIVLEPSHHSDHAVLAAFAAHQRRDKGFGAALGPDAPARAESALRALGYQVRSEASDWRIGADGSPLAREWLAGVAAAAREQQPAMEAHVAQWLAARTALVATGALRILVGHRDVLGVPPQ